LPPTVIFQGNDIGLDQAKEKYYETARVLREERLERLHHHGDIFNGDFEQILELDDDDKDEDFCYAIIGPGLIQISSTLPRARSSWSV